MIEELIDELKGTFPGGHPGFIPMTVEEIKLHSMKNTDYAKGGDPLGNFKRVSSILGNYPGLDLSSPASVAIVYALKQLDAALWMLSQGYEGKIEGVDQRLQDVHVYMKLARLLLKDEKADMTDTQQPGPPSLPLPDITVSGNLYDMYKKLVNPDLKKIAVPIIYGGGEASTYTKAQEEKISNNQAKEIK